MKRPSFLFYVGGTFLFSLSLLLLVHACNPLAQQGQPCKTSRDCDLNLTCRDFVCYPRRPTVEAIKDEVVQETEAIAEAPPETTAEKKPEPRPEEKPKTEVIREEAAPPDASEPPTERIVQPESKPELQPEPPPDLPAGPTYTIYDILHPTSSKRPPEGIFLETSEVVVTASSSRINATLSQIFVQEKQPFLGSYKYGGLSIIYDRTKITLPSLIPGSLVTLKGQFILYRTIDFNLNCLSDVDCKDPVRKACLDVFNKTNARIEKRCAAPISVPQLELLEAPKTKGQGPLPEAEEVQIASVRVDGTDAQAYMGVVVKVLNVVVTKSNPDGPNQDYSEFEIAPVGNLSQTLRVDDQINTITYTGSKFCACSSGKGDDTYCLSGDACQCVGPQVCGGTRQGCCFAQGTSATPDARKAQDGFNLIAGVFYFGFGNYKILPRLPTDLQKK